MRRLSLVARGRGGLLVLALCGAAASVPFVGPIAVAKADANDEARFYFERGNEILQQAMRARGPRRRTLLRDAVAQYLEAIARVRSKNAIYNLALCYQELGEPNEAWSYFREYRGMDGVTDDERADADRRLATLTPQVALIEVTSTPPGAEVRVDRPDLAARGRTPLIIPVEPGDRRILLRLAGHGAGEETVTAVRGEQRGVAIALRAEMVRVVFESVPAGATVTLDGRAIGRTPLRGRTSVGSHVLALEHRGQRLERRIEVSAEGGTFTERFPTSGGGVGTPGEDPTGGTLRVSSNVGDAEVLVDGELRGRGRATVSLAAGRHEIEVTAPRWAPYHGSVTIVAGQERTVTVTMRLDDGGSTLGILPELTLGAAGVALTAAIVMSVYATALNDDLDAIEQRWTTPGSGVDIDGDRQQARSLENQIDERNLVADVMWTSTVVLTGLAITLFILDEPDAGASSTATIGAAPLPGGGLAALTFPWPGEHPATRRTTRPRSASARARGAL